MEVMVSEFIDAYMFNLIFTGVVICAYGMFRMVLGPWIRRQAKKGRLKEAVSTKAISALNIILLIAMIASCCIVWGFDFKGLLTLAASLFAVMGVALFAAWSLISNVTAFFILLAHNSYKRGNFIRVLDADNYIEGYISEINLFNTTLISEGREVVIYPNNLLLTRPTLINPRDRLDTAGKLIPKNKPEA